MDLITILLKLCVEVGHLQSFSQIAKVKIIWDESESN